LVHVRAQYTAAEPASLIVFQDGAVNLDPTGAVRGPIVFDNLIHRGEMPVTIGVFVDPGEPGNLNAEYDAFTDAYATFLLTEILPQVRERYTITDNRTVGRLPAGAAAAVARSPSPGPGPTGSGACSASSAASPSSTRATATRR
jgi:enterochelin esterase-like enzyme